MIDPAPYARIAAYAAPIFSHDGARLFYLYGDGLPQIWECALVGGTVRQLTHHDERVSLTRRAPNDDRIVYAIDAGGDERHQLWLLQDGVSRPLTTDPATIHGMGAWSADGARISFTANDRDPAHFDVLAMDVATGARQRLHHGTHEVTVGGWNAAHRLIAIEDRSTPDQRPVIIGPDGSAAPLPRATAARFASLRWDGEALLGLTDAGGRDHMALCRIDPDSGTATPLFAPPEREVEAWALSSRGTLATLHNEYGSTILRVGPRDGERPVIPTQSAVIGDLAWSPDGATLAFAGSTVNTPAALFTLHAGHVIQFLAPDRDLPQRGLQHVEWDSFDGRRIDGLLGMPKGPPPPAGWPAIVWVHGGPASQTRPAFRADIQALLAQGIAVLMPNVRGSTGYGRAFMALDDLDRRLDSVADLAATGRWLAREPGIDPARIGIMGQSYGGYMALAALTEFPELWRCGVDLYGISDFVTLLDSTGPWRRAHRAAEYGDPIRHRALFDRISPLRHVDRIRVPLLVLHGTRDPRVAITESEQLVAVLQSRGRPVQYEVFDYAGHGFIRPGDKVRLYRAVATFLDAHL